MIQKVQLYHLFAFCIKAKCLHNILALIDLDSKFMTLYTQAHSVQNACTYFDLGTFITMVTNTKSACSGHSPLKKLLGSHGERTFKFLCARADVYITLFNEDMEVQIQQTV